MMARSRTVGYVRQMLQFFSENQKPLCKFCLRIPPLKYLRGNRSTAPWKLEKLEKFWKFQVLQCDHEDGQLWTGHSRPLVRRFLCFLAWNDGSDAISNEYNNALFTTLLRWWAFEPARTWKIQSLQKLSILKHQEISSYCMLWLIVTLYCLVLILIQMISKRSQALHGLLKQKAPSK
jgi:hypothetical protein